MVLTGTMYRSYAKENILNKIRERRANGYKDMPSKMATEMPEFEAIQLESFAKPVKKIRVPMAEGISRF
jgi:hypothetical protein